MKKQVITLALSIFFISTGILAQSEITWFDANWKKTSKDSAKFFRKPPQPKANGYWFEDYYMSGKIQMKGLSLKKDKEFYDGPVVWYYETGGIFQKVNYVKGYINGERFVYYKDGKLKVKLNYERGRKNGLSKEYYEDGRLKVQGSYKDNKKVGTWKSYYYKGVVND